MIPDVPRCFRCGVTRFDGDNDHGWITSWAEDGDGRRFCFDCAALLDKEYFTANGYLTCYLVRVAVTTWPGKGLGKVTGSYKVRHNWRNIEKVHVTVRMFDGRMAWGYAFPKSHDLIRLQAYK